MKLLLTTLLFCSFLLNTTYGHAQDSLKFPVPRGNPKQLFFLQRSQNANTYFLDLLRRKITKRGINFPATPARLRTINYLYFKRSLRTPLSCK
jgi:hypothetical protein